MANIHINIGSNQNRRQNISGAIESLKLIFNDLDFSSVYESPAEGFDGDDFYNIGVNAVTSMSIAKTSESLRKIEEQHGRDRTQPKFSSRVIDLDLVLYDDIVDESSNLPRDDILKYAFVLAPLAELNPKAIHPVELESYQALWQVFQLNKEYELTQYNVDQILKF